MREPTAAQTADGQAPDGAERKPSGRRPTQPLHPPGGPTDEATLPDRAGTLTTAQTADPVGAERDDHRTAWKECPAAAARHNPQPNAFAYLEEPEDGRRSPTERRPVRSSDGNQKLDNRARRDATAGPPPETLGK